MAANEVKLTIRVGDDGSLDVVAKKSKKAAKETENLQKTTEKTRRTREKFHKGEKGVAGATANSTKAFSKMRDSMTGSTGLVSAYAILASNVFAATAAFNALRRAAQIEQLEQGLRLVGAAAGANLPDIAKGLKEITGNAISSEQAMRSTALAVSSGFRSDQLRDLTKVAKGASIALGRDMGDALDRLVRGTAKLEPEILDELGIMVRLDDAVSDYADRLGIAEGNITQFDRRQAFLNATIEQGLKKFEDLSKGIDPNPYDKLASALADLQKNLINALTGFTGFSKSIEFASRNLGSLTAVATTLGLSVTRGVAPGIFNMADASAAAAKGLLGTRLELAKVVTTGAKLPPKFAGLVTSLQNGTATAAEFDSANASLTGQLGALTRQMNRAGEGTKEYDKIKDQIAGVRGQLALLPQLQMAQADATRQTATANAIGAATSLNFSETLKNLGVQFDNDTEITKENAKGKKGLRKGLMGLGPAFRVGITGAKALGAAFFTVLPYLGLIISAVSILYGVIKDKFFPEDIAQKRIDEAVDSFKQFDEITERFIRSQSGGGKRLAESYIALSGILDQISGKIREVAQANTDDLVNQTVEEASRRREINEAIKEKGRLLEIEQDKTFKTMESLEYEAVLIQDLRDLEKERLQIEANKASLKERITQAETDAAKGVLRGAILQLEIQMEIAKAQEESAFNVSLMDRSYSKLLELQAKLQTGSISYTQFLVELELLQRYPNAVKAAFQEIDQVVSSFNGVINERQQKTKALFQEEEEGAQAILNKFEDLSKKAKETTQLIIGEAPDGTIFETFVPTEEAKEAQRLLVELRERIKGLRIAEEFKNGEQGLKDFIKFIEDTRTAINKLKVSIAEQKVQLKGVGEAIKGITGGQSLFLETQNQLLKDQVAEVNLRIDAARKLSALSDEEFEKSEEYQKLLKERTNLETQIIDPKIIQARKAVDLIRLDEQRNKLLKDRLKLDNEAAKMAKRLNSLGAKLSPRDEFKFEVASAKLQERAARIDLDLTLQKAKLQRELLVLEMTANEVSEGKQREVLKLLNDQLAVTEQIARQRLSSAQQGVTATISGGVSERDFGIQSMANAAQDDPFLAQLAAQEQGMQQYAHAVEVASQAEANHAEKIRERTEARKALAEARKEYAADEEKNAAAYDAAMARVEDAQAAVDLAETAMLAAQKNVRMAGIQMVSDVMSALSATLAELGPEGKLAASLGNMSNIMLTSVVGAMEVMAAAGDNTAQKLAAGFSAAAAVIGGLGSVLRAQSDVAIAAVDKQIEAEKKRDGKSAESMARIKKMEQQKEAMKKKQFETQKKVQLAQAVMSTAAGVAGALAQTATLGPFATVLAAMIGAMGAAQIAIISGMTYQGGGTTDTAMPKSVSVGQRGNSTDMATSRGGAGELAYFRGAQGQGGPENFTPAFAGYKNRAEGGNTAFMVGEQGPELFVPERPGTIVPSDDVQTASTPINANINISAIDAAGVEDVLMNQRGNIISMIRDAANSQGNTFLEEINVAEL